jgi:hypothetical protein
MHSHCDGGDQAVMRRAPPRSACLSKVRRRGSTTTEAWLPIRSRRGAPDARARRLPKPKKLREAHGLCLGRARGRGESSHSGLGEGGLHSGLGEGGDGVGMRWGRWRRETDLASVKP